MTQYDEPQDNDRMPEDQRLESDSAQGGLDAIKEAVQADELGRLRRERDELYQRLARTTADFRNAQRRLEQDKEQSVQYANSSLIKSLLPVIDNLERALSVDPSAADADTILKGMQIIHDQWMDVLKRADVQEIAPAPGTPFDPNLHEALMRRPDGDYEHPTVTQLLQKGYLLHGRTLRPAGVAVGGNT